MCKTYTTINNQQAINIIEFKNINRDKYSACSKWVDKKEHKSNK